MNFVRYKVITIGVLAVLLMGFGVEKAKAADYGAMPWIPLLLLVDNDANDIISFIFDADENEEITSDVTGTVGDTTVALTVPYGTAVGALNPTIEISPGASVLPASLADQDFTNPVTYRVTAEDGTTKDYTVTVNTPIIAHWMFDEGAGTTASDSSGNDYDGTLMGTPLPQWIEREVGEGALEFDGSDDYVSVPYNEDFNAPDFTVTAWLANNNPDGTTSAYFRRIGGWHIRTSNLRWDIALDNYGVVVSGYNFPAPPEPGDPLVWHHYAITVSTTDQEIVFYVDGVKYGSPHTYTLGFATDSTDGLYIGQFGSPGYNWNGAIDDVRFYNEVLTEQEIGDLYNSY